MTPSILVRCEQIAREAHQHQRDRFDPTEPYILHVERVVAQLISPAEKCVGWLHDVVEDSPEWTIARLLAEGIPAYIVNAVHILTRDKGTRYDECILRVITSNDGMAMSVKIADIRDHLRAETLHRLPFHLTARYVAGLLELTKDR